MQKVTLLEKLSQNKFQQRVPRLNMIAHPKNLPMLKHTVSLNYYFKISLNDHKKDRIKLIDDFENRTDLQAQF